MSQKQHIASRIAQWVKVLAIKSDDLSLILRTHMTERTTLRCDPVTSCCLRVPSLTNSGFHIAQHIYTQIKKKNPKISYRHYTPGHSLRKLVCGA